MPAETPAPRSAGKAALRKLWVSARLAAELVQVRYKRTPTVPATTTTQPSPCRPFFTSFSPLCVSLLLGLLLRRGSAREHHLAGQRRGQAHHGDLLHAVVVAVAVEMLVSVSVAVKLTVTVTNAVDGGEYVTTLTETDIEVSRVVAVSVLMLVNVESDV